MNLPKTTFFQDFRAFVMRGNVVDLAVGVIIGGAFGKIVTSLVNDMVMPFIGLMLGGINFSKAHLVLKKAVLDAEGKVLQPAIELTYGNFLETIVDFVVIALAIFTVLRIYTQAQKLLEFKKKQEEATVPPAPPIPTKEEVLLAEIRDLLKKQVEK